MTIEQLLNAIAEALYNEFGNGYKIYVENVEQGLEEPCFLLRCLNPAVEKQVWKRYWRTNQFSIQYFPVGPEIQLECYQTAERLFQCLEDVYVDGMPVHGGNIAGQVEDDVLTVTVNYNLHTLKMEPPETDMGGVDVNSNVRSE